MRCALSRLPAWGVGGYLGIAASAKLISPCEALRMLDTLKLGVASTPLVSAAIAAELGVAALLIGLPRHRGSYAAAVVLILGLTAVLIWGVVQHGWRFRCACWGALGTSPAVLSLTANTTALALLAAAWPSRCASSEGVA